MELSGIKFSPLHVMKAFRSSPPYETSVFRSFITVKQFFSSMRPEIWKRSETKVAEGYCWAITQAPVRSCCSLSGSI